MGATNFRREVQTIDKATDRVTTVVVEIAGDAFAKRGNPKVYESLQLRESEAPTLLWAPDVYLQADDEPQPGDSVIWAGETWIVAAVDILNPDGAGTVTADVVISK